MSNIETRILSRLLMSFSSPDSADGENLSAAEMLTVVDITYELTNVHPRLVGLFKDTSDIAKKLEADPKYHLTEAEQKTVMGFFGVVEKSIAFQKGELSNLDFVSLEGLEV